MNANIPKYSQPSELTVMLEESEPNSARTLQRKFERAICLQVYGHESRDIPNLVINRCTKNPVRNGYHGQARLDSKLKATNTLDKDFKEMLWMHHLISNH